MVIVNSIIIERPTELKKIQETKKWILLYGRRKTGKTFITQTFIKYDEYFFVKTNKNILTKDNESITYETFIEILKRTLENNKLVVVDEFHRLGDEFFDFLHFTKKQGKLILISSTLFLSKKLISNKSALLGLFAEIQIGLISLNDTLKTIKSSLRHFNLSKKDELEIAILLREPITLDYYFFTEDKKNAREIICSIILSSIRTIPALTGEIFLEEERELSNVYEGVLRSIAINKFNSGEISNYLFSKKLIKKDDPSIIQQYLNNLIYFGIIKRIELFNKKRFVYKLVSPLAKIYYYIDEKYNLSERKVSESEILPIINEVMPKVVEDSVREFLAEKYGLNESIYESKDLEIDGCLLKFNKPEILLEVKWGKLNKKEILDIEENLKKIDAKRKILFVQDKKTIKSNLEVLDVGDLIK